MRTAEGGPPATLNRRQRRVEETRAKLLDAAEALLVEGGVHALTADEVAQRADVALQTVYNRIGGTEALLIAVAERAMEHTRSFMRDAYTQGSSVQERLRHVASRYIELALARPQSFRIFANPPDIANATSGIAELADEQHGQLATLLREGVECGELAAHLEPEATATALWGMLNGALSVALRNDAMRPASVSVEALLRSTLSVLEAGITPRTD